MMIILPRPESATTVGMPGNLNLPCWTLFFTNSPGHAPAAVGHKLLDDRRGLGRRGDGVALVQNLGVVSRVQHDKRAHPPPKQATMSLVNKYIPNTCHACMHSIPAETPVPKTARVSRPVPGCGHTSACEDMYINLSQNFAPPSHGGSPKVLSWNLLLSSYVDPFHGSEYLHKPYACVNLCM